MVVVIDYGIGNPGSILNMLKKVGVPARLSSEHDAIRQAEALILPGVGAFDHGIRALRERGLDSVLHEQVVERGKPILGICLGMQMFSQGSEEGNLPGLGWINAVTRRFRLSEEHASLRVPHMGWNWVSPRATDTLFRGYATRPRFYFVHSYHVVCHDSSEVLATTCYGEDFVCSVRRNNIFGTQFHPEKSHRFGMQILRNFAHQEVLTC